LTLTFIFALETESAPWRAHHAFRRVTEGGQIVHDAQIGKSQVRVATSGVRAPRIRELAPVAFAGRPDVVVAAGLAGALGPRYVAGDIIVPRNIRAAVSGPIISGDERLVSVASRCGAIVADSLLSVDHVVGRAEEKQRLADHADLVDMESYVVLSEAARCGIPGLAIRVIGDAADEDLPLDFTRGVRPDGGLDVPGLIAQAARRPDRWPSLVAFGWRQRRALRSLAAFLDRLVPELATDQSGPQSAKARDHGPRTT
jgi:nucleoside phosphorylase